MRVYVESNFVLELVLDQAQSSACDRLIELAERRSIELALPTYALLEPYTTLFRRESTRKTLICEIEREEKQLKRTVALQADIPRLRQATELLVRASQEGWERFADVRTRLASVAKLLAIDAIVLERAAKVEADFGLPLPDAVMLGAVHLAAEKTHSSPSVFLNTNTRDFRDPAVKSHLAQVGCEFIGSFDNGLARVQSMLKAT